MNTTTQHRSNETPVTFGVLSSRQEARLDGFLHGFTLSNHLSRFGTEILGIERVGSEKQVSASAVANLKLVNVPTYGTMVLRNESKERPMIVPMHIGFFQHGAQNHATSRVFILGAGEESRFEDCFCVQAAQGGLLQSTEQRFLMLPTGLRAAALRKQNSNEFGRLWDDIDDYTRKHGIARGGHLERLLRPNFAKLLPLRHGFESADKQCGGAYFIGGELVGIEVSPSSGYFRDLFPILSIYCFGPEALLAQRLGKSGQMFSPNIDAVSSREDIADRLKASREAHGADRHAAVQELLSRKWRMQNGEHRLGFRVSTIETEGWLGQAVYQEDELAYFSVFREQAAMKSN